MKVYNTTNDTVEFVALPVENIVDLFANICTETEKLAIYPMQDCLEEVSFTWVFTVK